MRNKQKLWRRAAASVKRQMIADGKHMPGDRYGRRIKAVQNGPKFKATPSLLFNFIALNAGVINFEINA